MPESRIAALASNPLLTSFAIDASQAAIKPIAKYLAPLCEVPSLSFHFKRYNAANRYRVARTRRSPGAPATALGFSADDASGILNPNALDFPIPNVDGLNDQELSYSIMEGQSILADQSGLAHESEVITTGINALTSGKINKDFSLTTVDPIAFLDNLIGQIKKAAKNGAPVKLLWGWDAFRKFRSNPKVTGRFVVSNRGGNAGGVGTVSPTIGDIGNLLINNPDNELSEFVIDRSEPGQDENIQFLLSDALIVFASNDTPNRMDPSFMKTFVKMGQFFKPGQYQTQDQRDEVLKMDWITLVEITNLLAAQMVDTTTGLQQAA